MVKKYPLKINTTKSVFRNSLSDDGDEFLKPEDMQNREIYAITHNPSDQPDMYLAKGLHDWWGEQQECFDKLHGCEVRLYLEVSRNGRCHWHGFIKIVDRVRFALFSVSLLKKWGKTKIRKFGIEKEEFDWFDEFADWFAYCLKLQHGVQELLVNEMLPMTFKDNTKKTRDLSDKEKIISTFSIRNRFKDL